MKEVTAFIRPEKWSITYQALIVAGVQDVSQHRVLGRGKQSGLRYLRRTADEAGGGMPYLPKRMVVCHVPDHLLPDVLEAIFQANRTGNVGDGKVFIRTIEVMDLSTPVASEPALAGVGVGS